MAVSMISLPSKSLQGVQPFRPLGPKARAPYSRHPSSVFVKIRIARTFGQKNRFDHLVLCATWALKAKSVYGLSITTLGYSVPHILHLAGYSCAFRLYPTESLYWLFGDLETKIGEDISDRKVVLQRYCSCSC